MNGSLYIVGELIPLVVGTKGLGTVRGGKAVAGTADAAIALREGKAVAGVTDAARVLREGQAVAGALDAASSARLIGIKNILEDLQAYSKLPELAMPGAPGVKMTFKEFQAMQNAERMAAEIKALEGAKGAAEVKALESAGVRAVDDIASGVGPKQFATKQFDEMGKLKPNVKYKAGEFGYNYETDVLGRLENFHTGDLKLTTRTGRLPHNQNTPGKLPGDHAGHLAGDRFGGSPELDNLVSQSSKVNLSEYKKLENRWTKAIEDGKNVKVEINVKYEAEGLRPKEFDIRYEIDGNATSVTLTN